MPEYRFENPETGEIREITQAMSDEHEYQEGNTKWLRVWESPNPNQNTRIDPLSEKDFVEKTRGKIDCAGKWQDRSKEMSERRKEKLGSDPVAKKFWAKWSAERKGRRPPPGVLD